MLRCVIIGVLAAVAVAATAQPAKHKQLIEFGWDEPDTAFLRTHIAEMQKTPFDGCVFHLNYKKVDGGAGSFTWEGWGKRAFTEEELRPARDDLKATPFGRFQSNFLRFNTCPADIDWFDDFSAVLNNARLAASIARRAGCPGLLFDIEQYNGKLFQYHSQRDAGTKSWEEYAHQVRLRGRQVMEAFQQGYPGLVVFMTFGYGLPWAQTANGTKPLADASYGLLAPFMDGLVDGAKGKTKIVEGNELAYGFMKPEDFPASYEMLTRKLLPIVADPARYRRVVSVSFGIWLDQDWRRKGWSDQDPSRNPHTPEQFEALTRQALQTADDYVWIYSETPRWWTPEGGPAKLPPAYAQALRNAALPAAMPQPDPAAWQTLHPNMPAEAVKRTTDAFPLSDQKNRGRWRKYGPMSDEFNGAELDSAKWWDTNPEWKGRQPGLFLPSNVRVDGEMLHLTMRKEGPPEAARADGYHTYTSAAVQSKGTVLYGYFEVRARPMKSAGSSAFWFYKNEKDWWTEIDVFEIGGRAPGFERKDNVTVHVFHTPTDSTHHQIGDAWIAPTDLADDFHVYGLEWDEKELKFYFDGALIRRGPNTHWHQPLTLNFDSETMPDWFGLPKDQDLPSTYDIDYIRAWKRERL